MLERLTGVVISGFGVALAIGITLGMRETNWNLIELSGRLVNLFVGPLAVFVLAGILIKRVSGISAIIGFMASVLVSIFVAFGKAIFGYEENISFTWIIPASFLVGFAAALLFSFLAADKEVSEAR
jgi:hypothetical protein